MASKAINLKLDEQEVKEIKNVAEVFHMTMTDVVREAVTEYVVKMKQDPFYRLTAMVEDASEEETAEVLDVIGELTDDDLKIVNTHRFTL